MLSARNRSTGERLPMPLKPISIDVKLFRGPRDADRSRQALCGLMFGLVQVNRGWLKHYPATPQFYRLGVLYRPERGTEAWADIPTILERGYGDCEDLACWRCAELNNKGVKASPYITWRKAGGRTIYHALVKWPNGKIEDPSRATGMGGHAITGEPVFLR